MSGKNELDHIVVPMSVVMKLFSNVCSDCMSAIRRELSINAIDIRKDQDRRLWNILESVAEEMKISTAQIIGGGNTPRLVEARQKVSVMARQFGYTYPRIGALLNKHHTTIIHLVKRHAQIENTHSGTEVSAAQALDRTAG